MKRTIIAGLALVLALGLLPQSAHAQSSGSTNPFWTSIFGNQNPALITPGVGIGVAAAVSSYYLSRKHGTPGGARAMSPGIAYGITSYACAVIYPMIGTVWLNRPLTPREAYVGMANCVVPVIGGWIVDRILPHDAWTDGTPPKKAGHHG